jgi:putative membrane protein
MKPILGIKSTLGWVFLLSLLMGAYSLLAVWKEHTQYDEVADQPANVYAVLSLVIGLLLVFRTNSAYDKWWEARTLWGALVNVSRNLAIKVQQLVPADHREKQLVAHHIIAFAHALKDHLRRGAADQPQPTDASKPPIWKHAPNGEVSPIYEQLAKWREQEIISEEGLWVLDRELRTFLDVCGGCERILKTRLAQSYRLFVNKCVALYLFTLPWGLVQDFGIWTVPMTIVLSYFLIGLEVVAHSIESPFGTEDDDLDLESICDAIERSVNEIIPQERNGT